MRKDFLPKMDRLELESLQLNRLRKIIDYCYENIPFYKTRLDSVGISSGSQIKSLDDIQKIPFTTKDDLATLYPYGNLAISRAQISEFHESSGSTGIPKVIAYSNKDRQNWGKAISRLFRFCGITELDVLQNATPYGMFTGGIGCHYGAMELGCGIIPASGGNTEKQLSMINYYGTTVLICTSSYALRIAEELCASPNKYNVDTLKKVWVGGEACTDSMKAKIEGALNCDVYNSYGLTEIWGPGFSGECICKNGLHINEDMFFPEIVSTDNKIVPNGEAGELVVTSLIAEAMPIIRYKTNDLTRFFSNDCACGNVFRRISPPFARLDDMIIIRGVNVYPYQIQKIIASFLFTSDQYLIELRRNEGRDTALLIIEYRQGYTKDEKNLDLANIIEKEIHSKLNIRMNVQLVEFGTLPRQSTKMRRVKDYRYDE